MFELIRVLAHTLSTLIILICRFCFSSCFKFLFFARACFLFCIVASYAYFYLTVSVLFFSPVLVLVVQSLCSQSGWLLLKWSTIGLGFDEAQTNCRVAHILGTLLMISY